MPFDDLLDGLNDSCLSVFAEESDIALTRVESSEDDAEETITGILEHGAELEPSAPGDGSVYARLFIKALDTAPERGDEISTATTVYTIVEIKEDGGGLRLLLRYDRVVT